MKRNTEKYVCLIALILAFSVGTASAQKQQSNQVQSRQQLRDQSNAGTAQQQQRIRNQNQIRHENSQARGQKNRQGNCRSDRQCQGKDKGKSGSSGGRG
jgi:Ni/Co efflux regulator RcnB